MPSNAALTVRLPPQATSRLVAAVTASRRPWPRNAIIETVTCKTCRVQMKELKGHIYHKKRKWKCPKCSRVRMQSHGLASKQQEPEEQ